MDDIVIRLEDDSDVNITVEDDSRVLLNMSDRLTIVQPTQHSDLLGLDYESSGHTGFVPARLSTLPDLNKQHNRLNVLVYVDDNGADAKISMREMFGLFVRTGNEKPADMQAGEYLFLEKNNR